MQSSDGGVWDKKSLCRIHLRLSPLGVKSLQSTKEPNLINKSLHTGAVHARQHLPKGAHHAGLSAGWLEAFLGDKPAPLDVTHEELNPRQPAGTKVWRGFAKHSWSPQRQKGEKTVLRICSGSWRAWCLWARLEKCILSYPGTNGWKQLSV